MKQTAFHIAADGTIEKCRKFPRCTVSKDHWAEASHAATHLDNIAYLAEVKAKVTEFNALARDYSNPQHFRAYFSKDLFHESPRRFAESIEKHVAHYGSLPTYLSGMLSWKFKLLPRVELHLDIETKPVINTEDATTTYEWTASLSEYHRYEWKDKYRNKKTLILDFSGNRSEINETLERLAQFFESVLHRTDPFRGGPLAKEPYAEEAQTMMERSMDMFNAFEWVYSKTANRQYTHIHGDFRNMTDENIIVDVEYGRSTFSAQTFKDLISEFRYHNTILDANIRVTDNRGAGDKTSRWSLYRKDGVWRVQVRQWDGQEFDTVATNAEEARGHIYWHIMNDFQSPVQEDALKVAQYGADLFTAVEEELHRNNSAVR